MILTHLHTTIASLLADEQRSTIPSSEVDVLFDIPSRTWVESLERPAVCCYLFDMAEVAEFRNAGAQVARTNGRAVVKLPPRRVDLRYLVCAFSSARADEQELVWRALQVLLKHTTLPPDLMPEQLQERLKSLDMAINTKVGPYPEAPKPLELWGALDLPPRPALLLSVTAPMELDLEFAEPLVLSRTVRFTRPLPPDERLGPGIDPARIKARAGVAGDFAPLSGVDTTEHVLHAENGAYRLAERDRAIHLLAGLVCRPRGEVVASATVGVVGRAIECTTNDRGHFSLPNVPRGPVRLWVKPPGKPLETFEFDGDMPWAFDIVLGLKASPA